MASYALTILDDIVSTTLPTFKIKPLPEQMISLQLITITLCHSSPVCCEEKFSGTSCSIVIDPVSMSGIIYISECECVELSWFRVTQMDPDAV